ncbi:hypothetical protein [Ewingella americana]|uniref:Uncharacterized protein n=1 Tax=Ewingella americana TaxID=41202 RepID=A0A502GGS3_9GAMM|nr:hypothetical protein [Ewingella americana]TPG61487.1 hypothetical protein EAH77_12665 [Ewingella americana]
MNIEHASTTLCLAERLDNDKQKNALLSWLTLIGDDSVPKPLTMAKFNIESDLELVRLFDEMCSLAEVVGSYNSDGKFMIKSLTERGELSYTRLISLK